MHSIALTSMVLAVRGLLPIAAQDIATGVKRAGSVSKQLALESMRGQIERMVASEADDQ